MNTNTIPPEWWERTQGLSPAIRLTHLTLLALADRDGVARLSSATLATHLGVERRDAASHVLTLERRGLLARWEDGLDWWVWVVHTLEWTPSRGASSRPRDASRPSPPRELVLEALRRLWGREPTPQEARGVCPRAWGRVRATKSTTNLDQEVVRVWEAWRDRQERPGACVLGEAARGLISRAMGEATPDQLILLFRYAWEADEPGPQFWRGANDRRRTYLGLDNLLVRSKLAGRVQAALAWESTVQDRGVQEDGTDLGPLARLRAAARAARASAGPQEGVDPGADSGGPPGGRVGPPGTTTSPDPRPPRLSRQCREILDLFLLRRDAGVRTSELARIALKYSARVSELRGAGADVVCVERSQDGDNLYAMVNWDSWEDPEAGEEVVHGVD